MGANFVSNLMQTDVVIEAFDTVTLDFIHVQPNYYRVQNMGDGRVYCGVTRMPTDIEYDFSCKAQSFKMHAEPYKRGYLYIYNPTGSPVHVRVLAFAADFDPLALAFSEFEIDFSSMRLDTSTSIDSFKAALPAGDNKIGRVEIDRFNTALPAGDNNIGRVGFCESLPAGENRIGSVEMAGELASVLQTIKSNSQNLAKIPTLVSRGTVNMKAGTISATGDITPDIGTVFRRLCFFDYPGTVIVTLKFTTPKGREYTITLKPDEVLNDIEICATKINVTFTGGGVACRYMLAESEA